MRRLMPTLLSLAACSDAGVTKFNTDPTAEISSHATGDTVREGYPETLRGSVGDANHGVGPLTVALGARGKVTMGVVALVNFSICFGLKLFFFKYS